MKTQQAHPERDMSGRVFACQRCGEHIGCALTAERKGGILDALAVFFGMMAHRCPAGGTARDIEPVDVDADGKLLTT